MELKKEWDDCEKGVLTGQYINDRYYSYIDIYTDSSKDENGKVGIGVHIPKMKTSIGRRLPDHLSV